MKQKVKSLRKLVRDKIPDEIAGEGRPYVKVDVLSGPKDLLLRRKLLEEVLELCRATKIDSLKEELADVFEVLSALGREHKIPMDEIESIRIAKRDARGGFDQGIFIDYVAPPAPEPEIGLFGPMVFVSVTKRTPRIKEIKVHEEHLLRIPLSSAFLHEKFRVGPYVVTYSDNEIFVRIQPEPNLTQLPLFEVDTKWYELHAHSDQLNRLLPRFEGYWKIYGNILLRIFGFPVPESIIILKLTSESERAVRAFCRQRRYASLLLRHDRYPEIPTAPRGGFLFPVRDLKRELAPFFADQRIVMLQEPLSPFGDLYSCNAILSRESAEVSLEIVGPGFDASDLNRGDVTPHEQWQIPCDQNSELNLAATRRLFQVDERTYQRSVRRRLVKIGRFVAGDYKLGGRIRARKRDEEDLIRLAKKTLKHQGQDLLLRNSETYPTIPPEEFEKFAREIHKFRSFIEAKLFMWKDEIGLSMGILASGRLVCWQVIWPKRKITVGEPSSRP